MANMGGHVEGAFFGYSRLNATRCVHLEQASFVPGKESFHRSLTCKCNLKCHKM